MDLYNVILYRKDDTYFAPTLPTYYILVIICISTFQKNNEHSQRNTYNLIEIRRPTYSYVCNQISQLISGVETNIFLIN